LADCNKLEAKVAPTREPKFEGSEGARAVGVRTGVVAIVEAKDVAGGGSRRGIPLRRNRFRVRGDGFHTTNEPIRGLWAPITGDESPHHRAHAVPLNDSSEPGTAKTKRRPKPARFLPGGCVNRFAATQQFGASLLGATKKEIGMGRGVITDEVAASCDFFGEGRGLTNILANQKKSGFGAMAVEEIQKLGSDGGVGAIVEGDGELAGLAGLENGVTEELRTRVNCPVGGHARETDRGGRSGDEPGSHRTYHRIDRVRARKSCPVSIGYLRLVIELAKLATEREISP